MIRLYTAAASAVAIVENGGMMLTLEERGAQCLAIDPNDPDTVYIGTSDEGLFRSSDGGRSWDRLAGVAHPRVTAIAVSPVDGALYAGTEPSSLFVSRDSGGSWRELEGLKSLPSASTWSFPPRPWTSHVRSLALSPEDPNLIVAGIELGGVVRSTDGGESWQDQRPGAYADCHALATHVSAPATLYEAAGGGFAESKDFGESWAVTDAGIAHRYVWGLAVDRDEPALLYVSAAEGHPSSNIWPSSPTPLSPTLIRPVPSTPGSGTGAYSIALTRGAAGTRSLKPPGWARSQRWQSSTHRYEAAISRASHICLKLGLH
jgi:photosystem II stability/assembly factor-like uncharacterized protein